jgi:2-polyprenyl-3-methyl-5-hydroxy-6-metoxy-1,4-benzoquinol methylase
MKDESNQRWDSCYDHDRDFGLMTSHMLTRLLAYTDPNLDRSCLDLGCGTGQLTRELFHRGYSCLGVDFSESAIRLARSLTDQTSRLKYVRHDIEQPQAADLPQRNYPLITCKLVIAFIKNKEQFLRKVHDLLTPGGTFVVVTPVYIELEEQTPISVDFNQTFALMKEVFTRVEHFPGAGNLVYFVCQ